MSQYNEEKCGTCGRSADRPFRTYDERGKVLSGCVDEIHTGRLVSPSESNSFHYRPEARKIRASLKKMLHKNPRDTSTRTEVRSPTRTSTSTKARTTGNITVTGGAGAGNTTVTLRKNPNGVMLNVKALPDKAVALGEILAVEYKSSRDSRNYRHAFAARNRPLLAHSMDGKTLILLGGAYRVTQRGIEDSGKG